MIRAAAGLLFLLGTAGALQAQAPTADSVGWNTSRALDLIERARVRRELPRGDTALRNYAAQARGHVYFYLDRRETSERTLVKTDQIALELYWAAPDFTKQRIVGLRDESRLPNRMHYHLDHLTVVQNGFGDVIRIGDGDEVQDVPHPAARGSDATYDFRLADSLTLNLAGSPPVRVYELNVRPRDTSRPGLVGSVFIEQNAGDIVRMTFTFTPASYVDRRLDYINISLDNGLWQGRYWLPNEQFVQIRRQVPELDFVAGAVIQGRLRVYGYDFNRDLPHALFFGRPVEALSLRERQSFAFEEELYAGLEREGLTEPPHVEVLRAQALGMLRNHKLTGLPPLRLNLPNASAVARQNRTEGTYLGAGATYVPGNGTRLEATFGYAFGLQKPEIVLTGRRPIGPASSIAVRGFYNDPRDAGLRRGVPGVLNTAASWFGRDYTDLYFTSGGDVSTRLPVRNTPLNLTAGVEAHRSRFDGLVGAVGSDEDRPAFPAQRGTLAFGRAGTGIPLHSGNRTRLELEVETEAGHFSADRNACPDASACALDQPGIYSRSTASLTAAYERGDRTFDATFRLTGGALWGDAPLQKLFLLGGQGTIPGHEYRGMIGTRFALGELEVARTVWRPWVRLRATAAAGIASGFDQQSPVLSPLYNEAASVGVGVGLFWDALRFDLIKGRGSPRLYFSVHPQFRDML